MVYTEAARGTEQALRTAGQAVQYRLNIDIAERDFCHSPILPVVRPASDAIRSAFLFHLQEILRHTEKRYTLNRSTGEGVTDPSEKALKTLGVYRIKPNPAGKDKTRYGSPSVAQLGGEWVDIRNSGKSSVNTSGVGLWHLAYPASGGKPEYRLVVNLPDCMLKPGEVLRVHAGQRRDLSVLNTEDRNGADWHSFTGEDAYVWNNREGDSPTLYERTTNETIDSATYDPHPPEGVVLHRQGAKLVPASVSSGIYR